MQKVSSTPTVISPADQPAIGDVFIRRLTADDLDGQIVDGPMSFEQARARTTELKAEDTADGAVFVITSY